LPTLLLSLHGCKQAECNNSYQLYFYGIPSLIPLLLLPEQNSFIVTWTEQFYCYLNRTVLLLPEQNIFIVTWTEQFYCYLNRTVLLLPEQNSFIVTWTEQFSSIYSLLWAIFTCLFVFPLPTAHALKNRIWQLLSSPT